MNKWSRLFGVDAAPSSAGVGDMLPVILPVTPRSELLLQLIVMKGVWQSCDKPTNLQVCSLS
jgi:hypothetical protein